MLEDSPSLRREVAAIVARELPRTRALVRVNLQDCGEQLRYEIDTVSFDEAQVIGDWLPDNP